MDLLTKYVIDSGPLINLKHFYNDIFVSFWKMFEQAIDEGKIISSSEVYRELKEQDDEITEWAKKYKSIFKKPELAEQQFVAEILQKHPELIRYISVKKGRAVADPFLIAQARNYQAALVTSEKYKPNAHNIPVICEEYGIESITFREMCLREGWKF